jgi:hypothetical protein
MAIVMFAVGCSAGPEGMPGSDAPSPPLSAIERAEDDVIGNVVRCLTDKGWDVTPVSDDSYEYHLPGDQTSRFEADEQACLEESGYDPAPPPLSHNEAVVVYETFLQVAQCVQSLGYPVTDPPSESAFVEALLAERIAPWNPYDGIVEVRDFRGLENVEQECPIRVP